MDEWTIKIESEWMRMIENKVKGRKDINEWAGENTT